MSEVHGAQRSGFKLPGVKNELITLWAIQNGPEYSTCTGAFWCYSAEAAMGACWALCWLLLASYDNKLQQVPSSQTAVLTKSHCHSDSIGCLSWVSNGICFKELSSWQPGEMGRALLFYPLSKQQERLATLGDSPTRAATVGRWIAAEDCPGSPVVHCGPTQQNTACALWAKQLGLWARRCLFIQKLPAKERCSH